MRSRTWLIAVLLFCSGFCALVYQVAWLRDFRLIFGASTAASAAVLAIFIGGLGLGGWLIGPYADRHPRPLLLYAQLEGIVAISAAATPLLLIVIRFLYLASGGSSTLGTVIAAVGRVTLSALVLALPTLAMGGTLPAAARAATRDSNLRRQDVAALYALNTLGAVTGCLVATFWLLELYGTRSTLWLAAGVNLLVAMAALQIDRSVPAPVESSPAHAGASPHLAAPAIRSKRRGGKHQAAEMQEPAVDLMPTAESGAPQNAAPLPLLLAAAGIVGFAFFLMELVWYRLLAPLLGGSVFTFGLVLAIALAGIGLGGLFYALTSSNRPATLLGFAGSCLLEAAAVAATYALGDRLAILALTLQPLSNAGFGPQVAGWAIVTAAVVLPPALVAGYQFPLLIALFGRGRQDVGRQIGLVYAANTLGAILGSLAGGFGFLPWLSATGAWRFVALVLIALGIVAAIAGMSARLRAQGARPIGLVAVHIGIAAVALLLLTAPGPSSIWRHTGIGAGRVLASDVLSSANQFRAWSALERRILMWDGDGVESGVALTFEPSGYSFFVNGKSDGSARSDAGTQVMLGLLGALTNRETKRALVIGLGTGSSAGWLAAVPSVDRVDVVELEPLVLAVARACAAVNRGVLDNPKVHITIGDAREVLQTTGEKYDLIASEPSNPFRAGIASLFTVEYYRAAAARLNYGGVFAQWVQGYEIDTPTLRTIYKTLATVFPQVETWQTNRGDLVLVASKEKRIHDVRYLAQRVSEEPFKSAMALAWRTVGVQGLFAHYLANPLFTEIIAGMGAVEINTDNRNIVEFGLARSVGHPLFAVADIRNAARNNGASRPPLDDETLVPWSVIDSAYISYNAGEGYFADVRYLGTAAEQFRQVALIQYYQNSNFDAARDAWRKQDGDARDPNELAMLAELAVAVDDVKGAESYIERLREYQPGEADVVLATLRLRQQRTADAAALLETAFARFRTDPWPLLRFKDRALQLAEIIASRDQSMSRRMYEAIGQPLAVHANEDARVITKAEMSRQVDFRALCPGAVGALEPNVPWTERFLRLRRDCYQQTNDPRLTIANRELDEFLANARLPIIQAGQ